MLNKLTYKTTENEKYFADITKVLKWIQLN